MWRRIARRLLSGQGHDCRGAHHERDESERASDRHTARRPCVVNCRSRLPCLFTDHSVDGGGQCVAVPRAVERIVKSKANMTGTDVSDGILTSVARQIVTVATAMLQHIAAAMPTGSG